MSASAALHFLIKLFVVSLICLSWRLAEPASTFLPLSKNSSMFMLVEATRVFSFSISSRIALECSLLTSSLIPFFLNKLKFIFISFGYNDIYAALILSRKKLYMPKKLLNKLFFICVYMK